MWSGEGQSEQYLLESWEQSSFYEERLLVNQMEEQAADVADGRASASSGIGIVVVAKLDLKKTGC